MTKRRPDSEVETAVEEMLGALDDHEFSTPEVSQFDTLAFWDGVLHGIQSRRAALKSDMRDEAPADDDDDEEPSLG